jgi:hypothetical protein
LNYIFNKEFNSMKRSGGYLIIGSLPGVLSGSVMPPTIDHPSNEDVILRVLGYVGTGAILGAVVERFRRQGS